MIIIIWHTLDRVNICNSSSIAHAPRCNQVSIQYVVICSDVSFPFLILKDTGSDTDGDPNIFPIKISLLPPSINKWLYNNGK